MPLEHESLLPKCLAGLGAHLQAEKEVIAVVRAIEDQAAEAVRDLALAELELPAGAAAVTAKLVPLLQWNKPSYDQASEQSPPGCHEPEPEPIPPSIDNWARGVVPCKNVSSVPGKPRPPSPRGDQEEEELALRGGEEQVSSKMPASNYHAGRRESKDKDTTSRAAKDVGDWNAARNRDDDDGRAWGGGNEEGEDIGLLSLFSEESHGLGDEKLAGAGGIGDAIGRGQQYEERAFLESLRRREEARIQEQAQARERLERMDKENRAKEEKMKKELKGRAWVWGPNGEVIILDVGLPEKIPVRVMPRIEVRDRSADGSGSDVTGNTSPLRGRPHTKVAPAPTREGGDSKASKGGRDGYGKNDVDGGGGSGGWGEGECRARNNGGRGRRAKRNDGAAAARRRKGSHSERFFEMSATTQPPLVDTLDLQAGVCVQQGGDEKQGPAFEEDHKHPPRRDLLPRGPLPTEPSLAQAPTPVSIGDATSVSAREGQSLDPPRGRRPSHGDPPSPPATHPLRSASIGSGSGRRAHHRASSNRDSLVNRVRTLDPLSGGKRIETGGTGARGGGGVGHHRGRRLVVPGGAEPEGFGVGSDDDPEDDPHLRLLKEGGNIGGGGGGGGGLKPVPPPPLPRERGSKQRRGVLAKPELRRPRDRGTQPPIPTVTRKHLPPPPLGETMGHGLSLPRDRGLGETHGGGSDAGGPSSPGIYAARHGETNKSDSKFKRGREGVAAHPADSSVGRKRKSGGGGAVGGSSESPHRMAGRERGGGKELPALPGQTKQQAFLPSSPGEGDRGDAGGENGGGRKARRRGSTSRMGWISSGRSKGTLQELFQTAEGVL
ncbi:unnamed protein product [Ectocarpus sp. 12 AP-2014]